MSSLVGGMLEKRDLLRAGESVRLGAWLTWGETG